MSWGSFENFVHMGGNGLYVWGSYAVALGLMIIEPIMAARRRRQALNRAQEDSES